MTGAFHWENVYSQKSESELSWHQDDPSLSLELLRLAGLGAEHSVIDIGAGTSRIVDHLLAQGVRDISVLDMARSALDASRVRLGHAAETVTWIVGDVTQWHPTRQYDIWHDRAVFHFLVDPEPRAAYLSRLNASLAPGGHAVIATFSLDGPEKCSGLPVMRYSPESLAATLGAGFEALAERQHVHQTPWGSVQAFQYSLFRKV